MELVAALLEWYRREHRKLPWRAQPGTGGLGDPYHVLVSEAMLQQTQVATVINYFERFVREFPTIQALAAADEQDVLRAWQGLGYYRRARNLHAAARAIVPRKQMPRTIDELRELPGVGPYTAGAIASIAFGEAAAVVDGNVARVIGRLAAIDDAVDSTPGRKSVWLIAQQLVDAAQKHGDGFTTGDFNQALMELGARVCTPMNPTCMFCPVRNGCEAAQRGQIDHYPVTSPRREPTAVTHRILVIRRGSKLLFTQRPDRGLWSGMWEMPTCEAPQESAAWAVNRLAVRVKLGEEVGRFVHITTHRRITFVLHETRITGGRLKRGIAQWRPPEGVDDLPLSNAQRKALRILVGQDLSCREPAEKPAHVKTRSAVSAG